MLTVKPSCYYIRHIGYKHGIGCGCQSIEELKAESALTDEQLEWIVESLVNKPLFTGPKYLLAIDPARFAGWALFRSGKLEQYGEADGSMWHTFTKSMEAIIKYCPEIVQMPEAQCVIEQGWSNGSKGSMTLALRRGIAQAAAESYGFRRFTYVHSATWQNGLYGALAGRDTKKLSLAYVSKTWQVSNITHDVADAIALGSYFLGARNVVSV